MIVIIDYGVGNLFSLKSSLSAIGADVIISGEKEMIKKADKLILPGVGAFEDAAKKLKAHGIDEIIKKEVKKGKPILGICLGMQMLFEKSFEFGEHEGLGLIKGEIVPMEGVIPTNLKIPHIGWNSLIFKKSNSKLFKYIRNGDFVYFVHSYYASNCDENILATSEYGVELTAAIEKDNIFGCQFHPEKSGEVGLNILKAFCE